ncbi:uncharacterized protein J3D65DRAFT_605947 [Phyllosticta citribraziliensis]|uniref:Uncharacterized protein n=1 Tax=Phyllosticta citribraziliensis TaxID=989973 RepID=A0ABR1L9R0_9PEZI
MLLCLAEVSSCLTSPFLTLLQFSAAMLPLDSKGRVSAWSPKLEDLNLADPNSQKIRPKLLLFHPVSLCSSSRCSGIKIPAIPLPEAGEFASISSHAPGTLSSLQTLGEAIRCQKEQRVSIPQDGDDFAARQAITNKGRARKDFSLGIPQHQEHQRDGRPQDNPIPFARPASLRLPLKLASGFKTKAGMPARARQAPSHQDPSRDMYDHRASRKTMPATQQRSDTPTAASVPRPGNPAIQQRTAEPKSPQHQTQHPEALSVHRSKHSSTTTTPQRYADIHSPAVAGQGRRAHVQPAAVG